MSRTTNRGLPAQAPPPPSTELRQRALAAFTLGALSMLALAFVHTGNLHRAVYVIVMAVVFAVIAIWLGVTTRRQSRRDGTARPRGAFSGILFGAFGLALSLLWAAALALFWHQLMAYSTCLNQANSVATTQACYDQLTSAIHSRIALLRSGG
jgi:uncharacterized protein YacL